MKILVGYPLIYRHLSTTTLLLLISIKPYSLDGQDPQQQRRQEQQRWKPTSTDPRASTDDAIPNAPNHATNNGQYATKSTGTIAAAKRQAWRFLEEQATKFLTLRGADGCLRLA
jgi:hypothetical protein